MPAAHPRRAGRPSVKVLSYKMIVEAAIKLLDKHGNDGFGMRDVAEVLGVRPSALYNHVSGKEDILRGIRELIGDRISIDVITEAAWDVGLENWARDYRAEFAAHPPTIALLAVMPVHPESSVSTVYDAVIRSLHSEGWTRAEALNILVTLESFILGSALDAAAAPDMMNPGDRTDVPDFTAAYRDREAVVERTGTSPTELAFETGLQLLLNGLRAEHRARELEAAGAATEPA